MVLLSQNARLSVDAIVRGHSLRTTASTSSTRYWTLRRTLSEARPLDERRRHRRTPLDARPPDERRRHRTPRRRLTQPIAWPEEEEEEGAPAPPPPLPHAKDHLQTAAWSLTA
jgi:hypothetical protein